MIGTISNKLSDRLIQRGYLEAEHKSVWEYAIRCRIEKIITFVAMLTISAVFFHNVLCLAVYLLFLTPLRRHAGGYHAASFAGCFSFTMVTFIIISAALPFFSGHVLLMIVGAAISSIIILLAAPINHPNYNGSTAEMDYHKSQSRLWVFIEFTVLLVVVQAFPTSYAYYAACALATVAMCLMLAKVTGQEVPARRDRGRDDEREDVA